MATPIPPPDFADVLYESKRIINSHSRHFLALSVLFLLPLSFSIAIFPTLHHLNLSRRFTQALLRFSATDHLNLTTTRTLHIAITYFFLLSLFSLCAVGSLVFSVFHGFYDHPLKLVSSIKSLSRSVIPLFVTSTFMNLVVLGFCFAFGLLLILVYGGIRYLGFQISHTSPYFIRFSMMCLVCLLLLGVYLQVNWAVVSIIVVVESSWGIEPLRRSTSLVKGMKRLSLSIVLFFWVFIGMVVWINSCSSSPIFNGTGRSCWRTMAFIVQIVVTSALISLLILHNVAATTVFYMYCKAMRGELAAEIAEEFAQEYISLSFDAEKVPHVVSVIQA